MRVLIVRTSSMGDLIHTLPAISDLAGHFPGVQIDWVAEDSFAEIPTWHPAVHRVIPTALRRWRRQWQSPATWREWGAYRRDLRRDPYNAIIDLQGLIKSAVLVAARARGPIYGLDRHSAREPMAALWYDHRYPVARMQPAVMRYRSLMGQAMGYEPRGPADFALGTLCRTPAELGLAEAQLWPGALSKSQPYVTIMPSASRDRKLWPEADWQAVLQHLQSLGLKAVLLAGNVAERERAERLAQTVPGSSVLPRLSLRETAAVLWGARLMVGLDSGLTHLSAALGRPTLGIYCATPVVRTPISGPGHAVSLGDRGAPPSLPEVLAAIDAAMALPERE